MISRVQLKQFVCLDRKINIEEVYRMLQNGWAGYKFSGFIDNFDKQNSRIHFLFRLFSTASYHFVFFENKIIS